MPHGIYPYLCDRMLKRLLISFCLLVAFAMLQAHNFIPHHHVQEPVESSHHHDHDGSGHHHHDHGSDFPFSDQSHDAEFGKAIVKPHEVEDIILKPFLFEDPLSMLYRSLISSQSHDFYHPPDHESSLHIIFLYHSIPLRAPPFIA
jgi:hypothetical protein